jgi:hypothetical protein
MEVPGNVMHIIEAIKDQYPLDADPFQTPKEELHHVIGEDTPSHKVSAPNKIVRLKKR